MEEPENSNTLICSRLLRHMEVKAYAEVVSAFRAQGGLGETKIRLLDQLRSVLLVSGDRHKAEVRRAANDEKLTTIARSLNPGADVAAEWYEEGRREIPPLSEAEVGARNSEEVKADVAEIAQQINVDNARIAQLTRAAEFVENAASAAAATNQPKKRGRKRKVVVEATLVDNGVKTEHPGLAIANQKLMEGGNIGDGLSAADEFNETGHLSLSQPPKAKVSKPRGGKQRLFVRTKKFGELEPLKSRSFKGAGRKPTKRGGATGRHPGRPRLDLKGLCHMLRQTNANASGNGDPNNPSTSAELSRKDKTAEEKKASQLYVKNGKLKRGRPRKRPIPGLLQSSPGISRSGRKLNPTPKMSSSHEDVSSDTDLSSDAEADIAAFKDAPRYGNGAEFISNEEFYSRNPHREFDDQAQLRAADSPHMRPAAGGKQSASIKEIVESVAKSSSGLPLPAATRAYVKPTGKMYQVQQSTIVYTTANSPSPVQKVYTTSGPNSFITTTSPGVMDGSLLSSSNLASASSTGAPFKSGLTLLAECVKKSTSFASPSSSATVVTPTRRVITAFTMGNSNTKQGSLPTASPTQSYIVLSNGNRIHPSTPTKVISVTDTSGSGDRSDFQQQQKPIIILQSGAQK